MFTNGDTRKAHKYNRVHTMTAGVAASPKQKNGNKVVYCTRQIYIL